jgi:anti-anti-sigma regulatory factor
MSTFTKNGALVLSLDQPFNKEHSAAHAKEIATALGEAEATGVLKIELHSAESPDASGLAVLIAASNEARSRSVELRLGLPQKLAEIAEDLRFGKLAVLETPEVAR